MRKVFTKEITFTSFNVCKLSVENGTPKTVELPSEKMNGLIPHNKIQKELKRKYPNENVMTYNIEVSKLTYEMTIEDFLKHAKPKTEGNEK